MIEGRDVPTSPDELDAWLTSAEEHAAALISGFLKRTLIPEWRRFHRTAQAMTAAGDLSAFDDFPGHWQEFIESDLIPPLTGIHIDGGLSAFITAPGVPDAFAPDWATVMNRSAVDYQVQATNRLAGVGNGMWLEVKSLSVDALSEGVTNETLKQGIEDLTGFSEFRADTIARTETVAAYNGGDMAGARALGEHGPVEKLWLAALDARTRDSHASANDQVVPFDGKFMVGGWAMDRPHDPGAPPEEVVNCRCVVLFLYLGDVRPDGSIVGEDQEGSEADAIGEFEEIEKPPREYANSRDPDEALERLQLAEMDAEKAGYDPRQGSHPAVSPDGTRFNTDEVVNAAMKREGLAGTPRIAASAREIDDLIDNGYYEAFRGAPADAIQSFMTGEYQTGLGIYGNGYYSAAKLPSHLRSAPLSPGLDAAGIARQYARSDGDVVRMAIDPRARIITENELSELTRKVVAKSPGTYVDPGRVAAANGWDAIAVASGDYLVILNREVATAFNMGTG